MAGRDEQREIRRRLEALGAVCHRDRAGRAQVLVATKQATGPPVIQSTSHHREFLADAPLSRASPIGKLLQEGCESLLRSKNVGSTNIERTAPKWTEELYYDVKPGASVVDWLGPLLDPTRPAWGVVDLLQDRRVAVAAQYKAGAFGDAHPLDVTPGSVALVYLGHSHPTDPVQLGTIVADAQGRDAPLHTGFAHVRLWRALSSGQMRFRVPLRNLALTRGATPAVPGPAAGTASAAARDARVDACKGLPDVQLKLAAMERALRDEPGALDARGLLMYVRHAAGEAATAGPCRAGLHRLATQLDARFCREDAAAIVTDPETRHVILTGDAASAARAMTAELSVGKAGPSEIKRLESCLHAIATSGPETAMTAPALRRLREEHGGQGVDPVVIKEADVACANLPQAALISETLRNPPTDAKAWRALRAGIVGVSANAINCRAAVVRAEASAVREVCRTTLRATLERLRPEKAARGSLGQLAERVAFEIRAGGGEKLWASGGDAEAAEARRCLAVASPEVAEQLRNELGEPADDVLNAAEEGSQLNARLLQRQARAATEAALVACETVAAGRLGSGLRQLDRANALQAYDAAASAVRREISDLIAAEAAESKHAVPTGLARQGPQLQGCASAAEKALRLREESLCAPMLLRAAETPATAPLREAQREQLLRQIVPTTDSGELLRCARALDPELTALLLRQKELAARDDLGPTSSPEGLAARRAVCEAVAALGGPPLNPLNAVTLLGLAGLPEWGQRAGDWLRGRASRAPNQAAATSGSFKQLHAAIEGLAEHHEDFEDLAALPCAAKADAYAGPWWRLASSGAQKAEAAALLEDLTALHGAMLRAGLGAAKTAPTLPRHGIFQHLWESFLRYALRYPAGPVLRTAQDLRLHGWLTDAAAPKAVSEFVRLEALFYLVLFDATWILRARPKNESVWGRIDSSLRRVGSQWPWRLTTTESQDLAEAALLAMAQSLEAGKHPDSTEDLAPYVDPTFRSQLWGAGDFRKQLLAGASPTRYLPAPRAFPFIPFA